MRVGSAGTLVGNTRALCAVGAARCAARELRRLLGPHERRPVAHGARGLLQAAAGTALHHSGRRPPARTPALGREGGNQGAKEGEGLHAVACTLRHSVRRKGVRAKPTECQRGIGALVEHTLYFVCIASVATECRHWRIRRENVAVVCRRRPAVRPSAILRYILHCILDVEW